MGLKDILRNFNIKSWKKLELLNKDMILSNCFSECVLL